MPATMPMPNAAIPINFHLDVSPEGELAASFVAPVGVAGEGELADEEVEVVVLNCVVAAPDARVDTERNAVETVA